MSASGDDGWWLASDGNWYPPSASPGRRWRRRDGLALIVVLLAAAGAAWFRFGAPEGDSADAVPVPEVSGGSSVPTTGDEGNEPETELTDRDYEIGDCVTWGTDAGLQAVSVVDCAEPHRIEISGMVLLDAQDYPTDAEWDAVRAESCRTLNEALLGQPLDPYGRVWAGSITPTPEAWRFGDRTVWCGLSTFGDRSDPSDMASSTGSVVGVDQSNVFATGSCLRAGEAQVLPCDEPHDHEVTGTIRLAEDVVLPRPEDSAGWQSLVGEDCERVGIEYVGGPYADGHATGWLTMEPASYAAGSRLLNCIIGRTDGTTFVESTGSVLDG